MAVQTGNTYITGTMIDSIDIPTAIQGAVGNEQICFLLLKLVGAFLPPSATRVRKIEAQYEG